MATAFSRAGVVRHVERVAVFIDNNSLFQALHQLGIERRLDYKKLKDWLLKQRVPLGVRFYCGEVRTDWRHRQQFYEVLRRAGFDIVRIFQGKSREGNAAFDLSNCLRVDCEITWDICVSLQRETCDRVILVSGSRELARVVAKVKEQGVAVEVVFFEEACSPDLLRGATCFRNLEMESLGLGRSPSSV
jgi:uncharacterized LabA/DUF88 family protein